MILRTGSWVLGILFFLYLGANPKGLAAENQGLLFEYHPKEGSQKKPAPGSNMIYLERLEDHSLGSKTVLNFQAGQSALNRLEISNSHYTFTYPKNARAASFGMGAETSLGRLFGQWNARADLGYGLYSSDVALSGSERATKLRFHLLPITASIMYLADYGPAMKWILPVLGAGLGYAAYFQTGELDSASARGGSWLARFSLGFRHSLGWMGLKESQLTADYLVNTRFSSSDPNLAGQAVLAGLATTL